ncbi:lactate dehydrogenase-like 2-hydroxyacid dehydrogenase [Hydrogenispora ethanolica]|uniref:Lactate dehydrogenase-like 2-hydroxyacid dehydrogenase n=1 Tax=Hydrogenispora ethanolica TaxID=1082276 RepID=A0A4R1R1T1_HYDET|nr:D-glycerate dehydrogenase [Hydrogenispora ethanolica]TCL59252.1 lactate dehydrogenase-like 2-hydroxyacid dehydrogenase [Hydrogenispora ethanolica]
MPKWNVYVTRMIPQPAIERLQQHCEVTVNSEDRVLTRAELLREVAGRDAVLCLLTDTIDVAVLDAAKGAKIFANYAVGYNNIDLQAASDRGILITNTPGVLTDTTAELAWALLFAVARRVVPADQFTRAGRFEGWGPMLFLGQDVTGKTLGIFGGGRIGSAFGKKAKGFEMKLLYCDVQRNPEFEAETGAEYVTKERLLRESDFVSLHIPLLPETRHFIGAAELRLMKPTAILINTSRGPVIDEAALVDALWNRTIWGAGLDVFEAEPELAPGLTELDNVVILPHIASATIATRTQMGLMAAENILAALRGETPPNWVNR